MLVKEKLFYLSKAGRKGLLLKATSTFAKGQKTHTHSPSALCTQLTQPLCLNTQIPHYSALCTITE
jgi:hypothetical protein